MEVVIPVMEFDFNSARSSPRSTAPSTPTRVGGGCFFSAPTSPTRLSEFYREFDRFSAMGDRQSSRRSNSLAIPFDWEEKPGTPKTPRGEEEKEADDFAFDFSEALEKTSLSAEDLFDGGKIKPLKPPPRLQVDEYNYNQRSPLLSSPHSPQSPLSQGRKLIREAFSPRKKKDRDPFATAIETSRNQTDHHSRGRERAQDLSKNSSRRTTRSLSPYRVSAYPWEEEEKQRQNESTTNKPSSLNSTKPSLSSSKGSSRKWSLRDIFLFRSASEGHATDKDRFRSIFFKKPEDNKNSSSKPRESSGSGGSRSRRKVSAHELHYTANKAVSENMKKKTFLPYKQGILGRFAFIPLSGGY
ncbi:hypothetical protein like AT2G26530 [Hibiscus trionum]|uniref:Uncharacterized protein n=1 Tax=Hibiscus trionum TaxID=183268 RepID=A0A9W7M7R7_HIBTR|nr:hypothetical protein like AT2G26530 [Hibiscus trionum]